MTGNTAPCYVCVENITGTDVYNLERKKLNNKLETKCRKCSQIICKHQIKRICEKCKDVWMRTLCCKPVV